MGKFSLIMLLKLLQQFDLVLNVVVEKAAGECGDSAAKVHHVYDQADHSGLGVTVGHVAEGETHAEVGQSGLEAELTEELAEEPHLHDQEACLVSELHGWQGGAQLGPLSALVQQLHDFVDGQVSGNHVEQAVGHSPAVILQLLHNLVDGQLNVVHVEQGGGYTPAVVLQLQDLVDGQESGDHVEQGVGSPPAAIL